MSNSRRNPGKRVATIKDVAFEAGVSPMTVSRVVNRKGNVKPSTIDKIQKAIAKVNYRPNIGARRLSGGRTYQVLMIFNNPNVAWTGELLIGMMHACRNIGYHLLIEGIGDYEGDTIGAPIDYEEIADLIDRSRVDGVILPPPICFDRKVLDIVREKAVPCVRIAGAPAHDINLRVGIDNFAAAHDIANHLISLGHENVAIIKGPEEYVASALRYEGFASAIRDHGLELSESNISTGNFDVESGYACAREPKLTTIRQPLRAIGEKSVELLESYIRHLDTNTTETVQPNLLLDYELKVRQSTAQCPHDNQ